MDETSYKIAPAAGEIFLIRRLIVTVEDSGTLDSGGYGNGVALTNGVKLKTTIDSVETLVAGGYPIKTNSEWGSLCYDVDRKNWGSGNEFLLARYSFDRYLAPGLILEGNKGDQLELVLSDNLTVLVKHHFLAQGEKLLTRSGYFADYRGVL